MSRQNVACKFFLQGNCNHGSSCRFLHSDGRPPRRTNSQHRNDCRPNNNRNVNQQYYSDDRYNHSTSNRDYDQYEEENYQQNYRNNNYCSTKDNYHRDDYHYYKNYYNSHNDNNINRKHKERNVKNHNREDDFIEETNVNVNKRNNNKTNGSYDQSNYDNIRNYTNNYGSHKSSDGYKKGPENHFDNTYRYEQASMDKTNLLKYYASEIHAYQKQVKQDIDSNIWPFTCFNPIGHEYPIQSVGCLNLIEISFEEIRCDYYLLKAVCADSKLVHNRLVEELKCKARQQKEDILSLNDHVQDDMLATFAKCEQLKTNPAFNDPIQMDPSSYWDMSTRFLSTPMSYNEQLNSFSFVVKNEKPSAKCTPPTLKIIMQTEVYGKMECDAFDEENFTNYIPIMPPPEKYCL